MNFPANDRWFAEEILPHEPALRAWLRASYPALGDVDDIVQEAYSRILHARNKTIIATPRAFLFTTARNLALDQLRRRKIATFEPVEEMDRRFVIDDVPNAADAAGHQQELELLTLAIQSLPERCRQVLTLRKIYGLSQKQIAAQLGISESTVEVQVGNGVRKCAEFLARYGLP